MVENFTLKCIVLVSARLTLSDFRVPGFSTWIEITCLIHLCPLARYLRWCSTFICLEAIVAAPWAKFLKEMEEVWLQTRKKSEREERWLEEAQRIQGEIWQALKIAEWQHTYRNAKAMLPGKAKALLDPFEELSSRILFTRKDLDAFLRQSGALFA